MLKDHRQDAPCRRTGSNSQKGSLRAFLKVREPVLKVILSHIWSIYEVEPKKYKINLKYKSYDTG